MRIIVEERKRERERRGEGKEKAAYSVEYNLSFPTKR